VARYGSWAKLFTINDEIFRFSFISPLGKKDRVLRMAQVFLEF
jgi:hypothetical protein